jgi:hypothetical protein
MCQCSAGIGIISVKERPITVKFDFQLQVYRIISCKHNAKCAQMVLSQPSLAQQ